MPSFRPQNTRHGDVAEQCGLLLLQTAALVVPVPRTEDVGIDAVATLLRRYDSKRLLAEDSFYVQIKSHTNRTIDFAKDEIGWLLSLELPFAVASVDLSNASVELFCDHAISSAWAKNRDWEKLRLILGETQTSSSRQQDGVVELYLGPAIHRWSLSDALSSSFRDQFYAVVKPHIQLAARNIRRRAVGWTDSIRWETGKIPEQYGWEHSSAKSLSFDEVEEHAVPYLLGWVEECIRSGNLDALDDWIKVMEEAKLAANATKALRQDSRVP